MVQQMVQYDVSYQRRAFKSKIDPDGLRRMALESSLKQAARIVYSKSEGRWLITIKAGFVPFDMNEPVELMVIVPAGDDQYDDYLRAVKEFEGCITGYPFADPMDTTLRTIEKDSPKCEVCGSEEIAWVRAIRVLGFSEDTHFCTTHAQEQKDFRYCGPSSFYWYQLEPATT